MALPRTAITLVGLGALGATAVWLVARGGGGPRVETRIVDVAPAPAPAPVRPAEPIAPLAPTPQTIVRGRVTRAHAPVGGAQVVARGPGYATTTTAADGTFAIPLAAPGRWQLAASSDALGAASHVVTRTIAPDAHDPIVLRDLELAYGATIAGTVVDEHGAPVAGVVVLAQDLDEHDFGHATTDRAGAFRITALSGGDGEYELRVVANDGSDTPLAAPPDAKPTAIELPDGDAHADGVVLHVIAPPPRDAGTLHVAATGFATPPAITLRPLGARATTAWTGDAPLAPGAYLVQASAGAHSDAALATITAGARATITLRARAIAHVAGRVVADGAPFDCAAAPSVAGQVGAADAPPVRTDAQGRFALDAPAGDAEIHCWPVDAAWADVAAPIHTAAGARIELALTASRRGTTPSPLTLPPRPR